MQSLRTLWLQGNDIESLPSEISSWLPAIESLRLQNNKLVALLAQSIAFERQDHSKTITEPLEPNLLALLVEVAGLHGGFILGFPRALELSERADNARFGPDIIDLIQEPTASILADLTRQPKLVSERARRFVDVIDGALTTVGWETATQTSLLKTMGYYLQRFLARKEGKPGEKSNPPLPNLPYLPIRRSRVRDAKPVAPDCVEAVWRPRVRPANLAPGRRRGSARRH